jgi:tetratricopeptide (TPR) repeat protein
MAAESTSAALVVIALALAEPDPRADDLAAQAAAAFATPDYDAVTRALEEAYAIEPRPSFVYGLAQADRMGGRCAAAIDRYAKYLELDPPEAPAAEARLAIEECRAVLDARDRALALAREGDIAAARDVLTQLKAQRALVDVPELALARGDVEREAAQCDEARAAYRALEDLHPKVEVVELAREHARDCPARSSIPPPSAAPVEAPELLPRPKAPPWQRDKAAAAMAGVGSVAVAIGVGLVVGAFTLRRSAPDLDDEGDFADRVTTTKRMNVAGWSTLAVGCGLIVSSALRWGFLAREQRAGKPKKKRRR